MPRDYQKKRDRDNSAVKERSRQGRDIGKGYPKHGNLKRRRLCERSLQDFLLTYFPAAFTLPFSMDHRRVIAAMEDCGLAGGLFALAMPRGSGKTTLAERFALWCLLYGHRRFVALVSATEAAAGKLLAHIKRELLDNDLLAEDFRGVCYPIRRLENNGRRCVGQLFNGERTSIVWGKTQLTFPTMPDSACDGLNVSGATVTVAGLTGALRGQSHTLVSGEVIRPELALLDDPQTRESAASPAQTANRAAIIVGDVLGMAGPGRKISAILPCTVIQEGDLADQFLNRALHPEWRGEKTKAIYEWPEAEPLWNEYLRLRRGAAIGWGHRRGHRVLSDKPGGHGPRRRGRLAGEIQRGRIERRTAHGQPAPRPGA